MRRAFEENLERYNEIAQASAKDFSPEAKAALEPVKEFAFKLGAERRFSTIESQQAIYRLQQKKNKIMRELKRGLRAIDDPEVPPPGERQDAVPITFRGGEFVVPSRHTEVSLGDVLTDAEWGITYKMDETVPRALRRQYLVERAKHDLREQLDLQIIEDEVSSQRTDTLEKKSYKVMGDKNRETLGHTAERMVKTFLKKVAIDTGIDIEVLDADIYQDVHQKVDFIIKRRSHRRLAQVEETHHENLGVQFTISQHEETKQEKQAAIDKARQRPDSPVEDIVLVSVPFKDATVVYRNWEKTRAPGGPDHLWSIEKKAEIVRAVLADMLDPKDIEGLVEKISEREAVGV